MQPPTRATRSVPARAALLAVIGLLVAACGASPTPTAGPSASPAPTPSATATVAPTATPTAQPTPSPTPVPTVVLPTARPSGAPATAVTAWGEIWLDVPASYPVPDVGTREALSGPVSAVWMRGGRYRSIADGMVEKLKAAGWSIEAVGDGEPTSVVIDATKGSPACRTRVLVEAFDIGVRITALYAAACPWS